MDCNQIKIWDFLKINAVGRNKAIHIDKIAEHFGWPPKGTNNDDVRRMIKNMVMNDKLPIGTCPDGAFLFTNQEEREEAAHFIERKTRANVIRTINYYNQK